MSFRIPTNAAQGSAGISDGSTNLVGFGLALEALASEALTVPNDLGAALAGVSGRSGRGAALAGVPLWQGWIR